MSTEQVTATTRARYRAGQTTGEYDDLPPVALIIESGAMWLHDFLTPEQATALGTALCAAALAVESADEGSVMDAAEGLVKAAERHDALHVVPITYHAADPLYVSRDGLEGR